MKKIFVILAIFSVLGVSASCQRKENTSAPITEQPNQGEKPINSSKMKITIGNKTFTATFANTTSAEAFKAKLPLTLEMSDYGGFEKIATIDQLPSADKKENSLTAGDIMLYSGNTLVLFYDNHGGYSYTRIGKIDNPEGLKEVLGSGKVSVKFEISE